VYIYKVRYFNFAMFIYIYALTKFDVNNFDLFQTDTFLHDFDTRHKNLLHRPVASLSYFQSGVYYSGLQIFNKLTLEVNNCRSNESCFKTLLQKYIISNSFYSLEEYFHGN
jgi:hypothetical protein